MITLLSTLSRRKSSDSLPPIRSLSDIPLLKPFSSILRRFRLLILILSLLPFLIFSLLSPQILRLATAPTASIDSLHLLAPDLRALAQSPQQWIAHFLSHPQTSRIGCREYNAGAQSCVFSGLSCFNVSQRYGIHSPRVIFVDNSKRNYRTITSDTWCMSRHTSADPRYNSASRHWPIKNRDSVFAPQQSCLKGNWRTTSSLFYAFGGSLTSFLDAVKQGIVRWEPHLWLLHFDYISFNHNNHFLMDSLWMLDVSLWQDSLDMRQDPMSEFRDLLFRTEDRKVYFPQSEKQFNQQSTRDVNRLLYAMILRKNLTKLYPKYTAAQLKVPMTNSVRRITTSLKTAYPELAQVNLFHGNIQSDNKTQLVCTPRLAVGAKIGNGAHERVCRYLQQTGYSLFGIQPRPLKSMGRVRFPQPPKHVVILNRHLTRKLENVKELQDALKKELDPYNVTIQSLSTTDVVTAEENVRVMASAGVVITPHGSHTMSVIWMPRHSALIEIMPHGYTDYSFNLLAETCQVWFYELQGLRPPGKSADFFIKECNTKEPHYLVPCKKVRYIPIVVDVKKAVETVKFAFERLGYSMGRSW